jgi:hypothetical protein
MDTKKLKVCIFVHYSTSEKLPYYVKIYINELSLYFDKVKVLTNNSKITSENSLVNSNVSFEYFENRGYDFGMIYRYISKQNSDEFAELAFVNDSNILLNKLNKVIDTGRKSNSDFWGIIDSNEKPWFSTHTDNYHIQSHFLVLKEKAIKQLSHFFKQLNVNEIMNEPDPKQLRRMVIDRWEIGLSQYLLNQGLTSFSFIKSKDAGRKFKTKKKNLTHSHYLELIRLGYPLLKKKVTGKNGRFNFLKKRRNIFDELLPTCNPNWNFSAIYNEMTGVNSDT